VSGSKYKLAASEILADRKHAKDTINIGKQSFFPELIALVGGRHPNLDVLSFKNFISVT
jgi:hypothetical protein